MRTMGRFLLFLLAWTAVSSSKTSEFRSVPEAFEVVEAIEVVAVVVSECSFWARADGERVAKDEFVAISFFCSVVISSTRFSPFPSVLVWYASWSREEIAVGIGAFTSDMSTIAVSTSSTHCASVQPGVPPALPVRFGGGAASRFGFTRFGGGSMDAPPPRGRLLPAVPPTLAAAASRLWKPVPSDDGIEQRCRGRGGVGR